MGTAASRVTNSRFLRFAAVGTAGFVVNEAALWIALHVLGLDAYAGGIVSFLFSVTFTWWGNGTLTFREHAARAPRSVFAEWMKFVAANGLGFVVNYAVYASLIALAPKPLNNPFLALAFGTLAGLTFNFLLSSRLVFRPDTR
ncbi:MAG: GtrA family protein [Alphaproteobacteria bacterium]|nr:GtrA family protein [Alphaproteobacteria bacterium]